MLSFREHKYAIDTRLKIPLRIILGAIPYSGEEILANIFKEIPGLYYQPHPLGKLQFRAIARPDITEATEASEYLLDISLCEHKKLIEKTPLYLQKYWFDAGNNALFHPNCANEKYKSTPFCGNLTYLNAICSEAPIQLLRVNTEIFHALNFGRLIYDPWSSASLKIIFMVRDPRALIYERKLNPKCNSNCSDAAKICTRMRSNMRAILQYETFAPSRAK